MIEELHLRVPGISAEEAQQLGQRVALLLAERLPHSAHSQHLGALDLRTTIAEGTPRERLAEIIASEITKSLA